MAKKDAEHKSSIGTKTGWDFKWKLNDHLLGTNRFLAADKTEDDNHLQPLKHWRFHQAAVMQDWQGGGNDH